MLGADETLLEDCVIYGRTLAISNVFMMLQVAFQSFLITAERPRLGLWISILAGLANVMMDALLVYCLKWGIWGAAAYGAIMHIAFVFQAFYFGYAMSSTSIVGYHFDAENKTELQNVLRKSLVLTGTAALAMTASGGFFSSLIARIYVGYDRHFMT